MIREYGHHVTVWIGNLEHVVARHAVMPQGSHGDASRGERRAVSLGVIEHQVGVSKSAEPDALLTMSERVLLTMVGGKVVYERPDLPYP